jgi:hypothetical protein
VYVNEQKIQLTTIIDDNAQVDLFTPQGYEKVAHPNVQILQVPAVRVSLDPSNTLCTSTNAVKLDAHLRNGLKMYEGSFYLMTENSPEVPADVDVILAKNSIICEALGQNQLRITVLQIRPKTEG